ncbi:GNAT family N-acetyltransferase [Luteibaculum oceani]|uniref:GNAT family N-acetyltransferase n=1 Tax=Luteibaculum oceani TaxID=1294296 RepID=A0A5C6V8K7_9FLAO|nr:GNAT family N-acetyltransferase [Luteibaculum oceani]TXC81379.1 GNAT family N-acetyltransferase [Luteibaculum oceani]
MDIILRAPEPEDLDFFYQLENDRSNWIFGDTRQEISKQVLKQWLFHGVDVYEARHMRWVVQFQEKAVGSIDLYDIDFFHQSGYLAILLEKGSRGKGIAKKAMQKALVSARENLGLRNIFSEVSESNESSLMLFPSVGFEKIGVKKKSKRELDQWVDVNVFQKIL